MKIMNKKYLLAALIGVAALGTMLYNKQSAAASKREWLSSQHVRQYDKTPFSIEKYNITSVEYRYHSLNARYVFTLDSGDNVKIDRRGTTINVQHDATDNAWIEVRRYQLLNSEAFPGIGPAIQVDIHLKEGMEVTRVSSPNEPE